MDFDLSAYSCYMDSREEVKRHYNNVIASSPEIEGIDLLNEMAVERNHSMFYIRHHCPELYNDLIKKYQALGGEGLGPL